MAKGPRFQTANRAVKEYLATLNDAAFGAASEVTPKFVSPSDPAAQWTGAMRGPAFFAYADNYLVDVKFGVIVARDAARALAGTEAFEQSRRDRKRVEMLFAHLKRILKLGRLRLRRGGAVWGCGSSYESARPSGREVRRGVYFASPRRCRRREDCDDGGETAGRPADPPSSDRTRSDSIGSGPVPIQ